MATKFDPIYRGDTLLEYLAVTEAGAAVDLTDATITYTMKSSLDDADSAAVIQQDAVLNADPTTGLATLTVPAADMDALAGTYYCDYQLVQADGTVTTLAMGTRVVSKDVTRETS